MAGRSRLLVLLAITSLLALPALALRAFCVGHSCDTPARAGARIPFCSLQAEARDRIATGFREGRSPDVLAVAGVTPVRGGTAFSPGEPASRWPSASDDLAGSRVPLVLSGPGVRRGVSIPRGTPLDSIAPSIARAIGLKRPHPEVRSGRALDAVGPASADLVIEVVLKGIGSSDVERGPWSHLGRLMGQGASTLDADAGSLPLDPAAILTTIGTGALPFQHGITGASLRDDEGRLVRAWGRGAPPSVVATLPDDLDEETHGESKIGLVASVPEDRGLIGGDWYVDVDRDDVLIRRRGAARAVRSLLDDGYGRDEVPDLIVVTLQGTPAVMDAELGAIAGMFEGSRSPLIVVTGSGSTAAPSEDGLTGRAVAAWVERGFSPGAPVVEAATPGGLFLDQKVLAREAITEDEVMERMAVLERSGRVVFADVFPAIAVSFARYC